MAENTWCIVEPGYSPDTSKHYEGLLTQGNGYMHIRGSFEEGICDTPQDEEYDRKPANVTLEKHKRIKSKWGTYVPGIVGAHPFLKTETINLPYFFDLRFRVAGEALDMELSKITDYKRWLDLRDGSLYREFVWECKSGLKVKMSYHRFASMADKHLALQKVDMEVLSGEGELLVEAGIQGGVRTNGFNHFEKLTARQTKEGYIQLETITNGGGRVLMTSFLDAQNKMTFDPVCDGEKTYYTGKVSVKAGEEITFTKITSVCTGRDLEQGEADTRAVEYLEEGKKAGFEALYEKHKNIWDAKWQETDIKITGDDKAQLAIRMAAYHLTRADHENDPRIAICAKGYAGEAYCGRYFWDTEINMLPFFIHTNPQGAKSLIQFRYETLEGAKRNAASYGYHGARYAWESSVTGEEECACWQYADHEIHVTADIIYAMMHYVRATGDFEFIDKYGLEIMVETAKYWVERVDKDKEGNYNLFAVMGPDEYLPMTQNNAFTNKMVKFALTMTVQYLENFKQRDEATYKAFADKLGVDKKLLDTFCDVRDHIKTPYNKDTKIILQCDEFESYADLDFDAIWKDRSRCFGEFISQEKNYRSKALKQADVLELMMLYPEDFTRKQLEDNYDYYEPITTHDSSLSAAVHGILAARLDRMEEAERFLSKVIAIDMSEEKKGAEEGIHIANCGGLWQMIVYGFAGLKSGMWADEITLDPKFPSNWEEVEIPLKWHGEQYRIIVNRQGYKINHN